MARRKSLNLLGDTEDRRFLIEAIKQHGATTVAIDTAAKLLGARDESSSVDMGKLLELVTAIREETGAAVILVHHDGKLQESGSSKPKRPSPRGHSSLLGDIDTSIHIQEQRDGLRVATVTKARDAEEGQQFAYRLLPVQAGTNARGEPLTTCVVEEVSASEIVEEPKPAVGGAKRSKPPHGAASKVLELCCQLIRQEGREPPPEADAPAGCRAITQDRLREAACRPEVAGSGKPESRKKSFGRALDHLLAAGAIGASHGFVWPLT